MFDSALLGLLPDWAPQAVPETQATHPPQPAVTAAWQMAQQLAAALVMISRWAEPILQSAKPELLLARR